MKETSVLFPASRNNGQEGHFTAVFPVARKTTDTGRKVEALEMKGKGKWKGNAMHNAQQLLLGLYKPELWCALLSTSPDSSSMN